MNLPPTVAPLPIPPLVWHWQHPRHERPPRGLFSSWAAHGGASQIPGSRVPALPRFVSWVPRTRGLAGLTAGFPGSQAACRYPVSASS